MGACSKDRRDALGLGMQAEGSLLGCRGKILLRNSLGNPKPSSLSPQP